MENFKDRIKALRATCTESGISMADSLVNAFYNGEDCSSLFDAAKIYYESEGRMQEARRYFCRFVAAAEGDLQKVEQLGKAQWYIDRIDELCNAYINDYFGKYNPVDDEDLQFALDILQCIWEKKMVDNGENGGDVHFTIDGIYNADKGSWLSRKDRVVFVLKDQNQGDVKRKSTWDDDLRKWNLKGKGNFFPNIKRLLWGVTHTDRDYKNDIFFNPETKSKMEALIWEYAESTPFAMVECKKQPGYKRVSAKEINHHLKNYGELLIEEIRLLRPTHLLCASQEVYVFFLKVYGVLEKGEFGGCYDDVHDVHINHCFHPSNPGKHIDEHYNEVMQHLIHS